MKKYLILWLTIFVVLGCSNKKMQKTRVLNLGAYTAPREVYQKEIIPAFKRYWKGKTAEDICVRESYQASGSQSRAIISGYEADIAALSLEQDITELEKAGLITHNWKNKQYDGFVTRSIVVICVRPQNPKVIKDWEDLKRDDVDVIHPHPKTSGSGMWCVNAIYGSGLKLSEVYQKQKDREYAWNFLKMVQQRVKVMDKSGRASVITFENGIGDVLVTYESEALLRQKQGKEFPFIIPKATILIENPVTIIDKNVKKHQNRDLAEAFLEFLFSNESQRAFARYGFRPVNEVISLEFAGEYPKPEYLFEIHYLGGWEYVNTRIYGPDGIWTKLLQGLENEKIK